MLRASVSATPPGGKLTISLIDLSGQDCAPAGTDSAKAASSTATDLMAAEAILIVSLLSVRRSSRLSGNLDFDQCRHARVQCARDNVAQILRATHARAA